MMQERKMTLAHNVGAPQRAFRQIIRPALRAWLRLAARLNVEGLHHIPSYGAAIIAFNHLGHLDSLLVVALAPRAPECIALADLMSVPGTNLALRAYGVILIHRDQYDRQVIRAAMDVLKRGALLALAPEARQSPTAALEQGREGAAYLALKSGAPVVPVGITGTQHVYSAWRERTRPSIHVNVGAPFHVAAQAGAHQRQSIQAAHSIIMQHIAQLLPQAYRGYWA